MTVLAWDRPQQSARVLDALQEEDYLVVGQAQVLKDELVLSTLLVETGISSVEESGHTCALLGKQVRLVVGAKTGRPTPLSHLGLSITEPL
jgi:hypothetical protein